MKNPDNRAFIPYHAPALLDRAAECAKNQQGVATVILCISSVEALIHDLTEWYKFAIDHNAACPNKRQKEQSPLEGLLKNEHIICASQLHLITEKECDMCTKLQELEKNCRQLEEKVSEIFNTFQENRPPKGDKIWQEFIFLNKIRNGIIHTKGETLKQDNPFDEENRGEIDGYPDFIKNLQKRNLIATPEILDETTSWLELIEENPDFLKWCLVTTDNYIRITIGALPDSFMSKRFKKKIEL